MSFNLKLIFGVAVRVSALNHMKWGGVEVNNPNKVSNKNKKYE